MDTRPLILIVDDEPTNLHVLSEALRQHYRIKVTTSGPVALDIASSPANCPDLILLDVMMPEMDGYDVCRQLKARADTRNIPVIFITAKSYEEDEVRGLRLGAVDYISKPFSLPIVSARVRNHIKLKQKSDLLEALALVDGLTNVANRRRFDASLQAEWRRTQRTGSPISVLMIDVDHFKAYNDHHGHNSGDECLRQVATALDYVVGRVGDLIARWGGEEFIALLPDTPPEGARKVAEKMRSGVEALSIPHGHSDASPFVTVSIGVAERHADGADSPVSLTEAADKNLYEAKATGRNRVCG